MKLIFVHFQNHNKIYIYFLIIIFFFSFVLRIIHLNWGLPDIEEEAFPMKKAFEMWDWDNGKINLDPETAGWPSLSFYINFLLQLFHYAIGHLFGEFENRYDYFVAFKLDPTQVTLISRGLSLFSSIIIIYIGFKLAFEISGILPGLFVGLILSFSPFMIEYSQKITPDILLSVFSALAINKIIHLYKNGLKKDYLLTGLYVGLGISSKYTSILLFPAIYISHLYRRKNEQKSLKLLGINDNRLFLTILTCVIIFCFTSPYNLINFNIFKRDLNFQIEHMFKGHLSVQSNTNGYLYYIRQSFLPALGLPGFLFSISGLIYSCIRYRGVWLIILSCFIPYFLVLGSFQTMFPRYILPVILPISLGISAFINQLYLYLKNSGIKLKLLIFISIGVVILTPLITGSLKFHSIQNKPSTLQLAKEYINNNLSRKFFIAKEHYTPDLLNNQQIELMLSLVNKNLTENQKKLLLNRPFFYYLNIPFYATIPERCAFYYDLRHYLVFDYIITSGSVKDRFLKYPDLFPFQNKFYNDLNNYCKLVISFSPVNRRGPEINIYYFSYDNKEKLISEKGNFDNDYFKPFIEKLYYSHFTSFIDGIAVFAQLQNRFNIAESYYQLHYQISQNKDKYLVTSWLAFVKFRLGKFKEAETLYNELLSVKPNDVATLYNLGNVKQHQGNLNDAQHLYKLCINYDNKGKYSDSARAQLQNLKNRIK